MIPVYTAALLTLICYLINVFMKEKHVWHRYLMVFVVISGIGFFFSSIKSEAAEIPRTIDECMEMVAFAPTIERQHEIILDFISSQGSIPPKIRREFLAKAKKHKKDGCDAYGCAKDKCWLLPNLDDRKKAEICFNTGVAMAQAGTPYSKIVAAVLSLLAQYGFSCLNEWQYIDSKMQEASYNFGQYEWYMEILTKDNNS